MAIFKDLACLNNYKEYEKNLRKAFATFQPDTIQNFYYYEGFEFDDRKERPAVIVDFTNELLHQLRADVRRKFTGVGFVQVNSADRLVFVAETGHVHTRKLQKSFRMIGGLREVELDPNEQPEDAEVSAAPPAVPSVRPPLPVVPQQIGSLRLPADPEAQAALVETMVKGFARLDLHQAEEFKAKALAAIQQFQKAGETGKALQVLERLHTQVRYTGIDAWAMSPGDRKQKIEELTEQCVALGNLIRTRAKDPAKYQAEAAMLAGLPGRIAGFGVELTQAFTSVDPEAAQKIFERWKTLVAARQTIEERLKPIWLDRQKERFLKDFKANRDTPSADMRNQIGEETMLQRGQMAEVQVATYCEQLARTAEGARKAKQLLEVCQKLEVGELAALYGYSTADYASIAELLRKQGAANLSKADQDRVAALDRRFNASITVLLNALAKLPIYAGRPLIRCEKALWQGFIDEIAATGARVEKSFSSAGLKKVAGFGDIEVTITSCKTGREITMFSLHLTEGEVLFPAGSRFVFEKAQVVSIATGRTETFTDPKLLPTHVSVEKTKAGSFWFRQE